MLEFTKVPFQDFKIFYDVTNCLYSSFYAIGYRYCSYFSIIGKLRFLQQQNNHQKNYLKQMNNNFRKISALLQYILQYPRTFSENIVICS